MNHHIPSLALAVLVLTAPLARAVNVDLSGATTGTLITAPGASFAQTFAGQTVSGIGLTGSPTSPLSLLASGSLQVQFFDSANTILPQPGNVAPLAMLLDQAADAITWTMGSAAPPSSVTVDFFSATGSLVHTTVQSLSSGYSTYNFSGFGEFRGLSIYNNNDPAGLRYYNFSYNPSGGSTSVPDSGSVLGMFGAVLIALAGLTRRLGAIRR